MAKTRTTVSVSDLRQDGARVLQHMKKSNKPVVITQRGRAAAVMMSLGAYERSQAERELLLLLARGEQEIAAGIGRTLDDILGEAHSLLEE